MPCYLQWPVADLSHNLRATHQMLLKRRLCFTRHSQTLTVLRGWSHFMRAPYISVLGIQVGIQNVPGSAVTSFTVPGYPTRFYNPATQEIRQDSDGNAAGAQRTLDPVFEQELIRQLQQHCERRAESFREQNSQTGTKSSRVINIDGLAKQPITLTLWNMLNHAFQELHQAYTHLERECLLHGRSGFDADALIDLILDVSREHYSVFLIFSTKVASRLTERIEITDSGGQTLKAYSREDALAVTVKYASVLHLLLKDLARACFELGAITAPCSIGDIEDATARVNEAKAAINAELNGALANAMIEPIRPIDIFGVNFFPHENHPHNRK